MIEIISQMINTYNEFFVYYLLSINVIYVLLLFFASVNLYYYIQRKKYVESMKILNSPFSPGISILVPCYNEDKIIVSILNALTCLEYSNYEIIVINDGSTDDTLSKITNEFKLTEVPVVYNHKLECNKIRKILLSPSIKNLIVIDKENGGKADALNAGINISRNPLIISVDADSILESKTLLRMALPFINNFDNVAAAGGTIMILNGCTVDKGYIEKIQLPKNILARFQIIEYFRSFLGGRLGFSFINSLLIISGAFGMFKKDLLIAIGGYNKATVGEDMDIIIRLHKHIYNNKLKQEIFFNPEPVCWTQCPETFKDLYAQRKRWQRGLMDCLLGNKNLFMNPKYGSIGLFAYPYFVIFEMLEPIISILGYFILIFSIFTGRAEKYIILLFLLGSIVFGIFVTIFSVLIAEFSFKRYEKISDYFILILYSILESFGYRQVNSILRLCSICGYKYKNNKWGKFDRKELIANE